MNHEARVRGGTTAGELRRVLVVDDEIEVVTSICVLLAGEYQVTGTTSARRVASRIGIGERFDAIVCGSMLTDIPAVELYDRVAAVSSEQAARMVFITTPSDMQMTDDFLQRLASVLELGPRAHTVRSAAPARSRSGLWSLATRRLQRIG